MKGFQPDPSAEGCDLVPQHLLAPSQGEAEMSYVHDERVQLSDNLMHLLGKEVESGGLEAKVAGCTGVSPFIRYVDHLSYNNFFALPPAHAFGLGVIPDFWKYVVKKVGRPALRRMDRRIVHVLMTSDFGRPCRPLVPSDGTVMPNWTCEDVFHFTETVAPLVVRRVKIMIYCFECVVPLVVIQYFSYIID